MITTGSIVNNTNMDDLTERIKIVYTEPGRDEYGNVSAGTEVVRCEPWAKILPYATRSDADATARVNEVDIRMIIRYRDGILPTDQVIYRWRRFSMLAPPYDAENRHMWLVMECKELVADAEPSLS